MTTPQPSPARSNKLLLIIGGTVVVLLAVIAVAVGSQAIRGNQEAEAKASAVAEASKMAVIAEAGEKALSEQRAEEAKDASYVCEQRLLKKHPTATVQAGKTKSAYKASDGSYDTTGAYTDAPAGNPIPMQFVCSSVKGTGTSWTVFLSNDGHGSTIP